MPETILSTLNDTSFHTQNSPIKSSILIITPLYRQVNKSQDCMVAGERFESRQSAPWASTLGSSLASIQIHPGHRATSTGYFLVSTFMTSCMLHASAFCHLIYLHRETHHKKSEAEAWRTWLQSWGLRDNGREKGQWQPFHCHPRDGHHHTSSGRISLVASFCLHMSSLQRSLQGKGSISALFNSSLTTPSESQLAYASNEELELTHSDRPGTGRTPVR